MSDDAPKSRVTLDYPLAQFAKAMAKGGGRALSRVRSWWRVLAGMEAGSLWVGSRTPVAGLPAWVTLEVVQGGFATGELKANGPLQAHEHELLAELALPSAEADRRELNRHFVSQPGHGQLAELLKRGKYQIQVPEEGALLVWAWLMQHGEAARAHRLLESISPYFDRLRFYPAQVPQPSRDGTSVYLKTVGEVLVDVRGQADQPQIDSMKEAIEVWTPLYAQTVALFLETMDGDVPRLSEKDTALTSAPTRVVEGGWPCCRFPLDWHARAAQVLADYREAREVHRLCRKPDRPKENFARLRRYLALCVEKSNALTNGDVSAIRQILASYVTRHGTPGGGRWSHVRAQQVKNVGLPRHQKLADVLASRLARHPENDGIVELHAEVAEVNDEEASRLGVPTGTPIPPRLVRKARRCLKAPLDALVGEKIIKSAETMASVLPLLTAQVRAEAIENPELRHLFAGVYRAFRRRRTLLLLDLQSQTKLNELPWISAIAPWLGGDEASRQAARETIASIGEIALCRFPQTPLPNKLIKELRTLGAATGAANPHFVDELAADIFQGAFGVTFLRAAQVAAHLLKGTMYERYYGLPYERVLAFGVAPRGAVLVSPELAALCEEQSRRRLDWFHVAGNGMVIEQCQILTTHNLAALFRDPSFASRMRAHLPSMVRACFTWICAAHERLLRTEGSHLHVIKDTAYAFRQMLFFLSLMPSEDAARSRSWMADHFATGSEAYRQRFAPVMNGLEAIAAGSRFDAEGVHASSGGRRFLGWCQGVHWLTK